MKLITKKLLMFRNHHPSVIRFHFTDTDYVCVHCSVSYSLVLHICTNFFASLTSLQPQHTQQQPWLLPFCKNDILFHSLLFLAGILILFTFINSNRCKKLYRHSMFCIVIGLFFHRSESIFQIISLISSRKVDLTLLSMLEKFPCYKKEGRAAKLGIYQSLSKTKIVFMYYDILSCYLHQKKLEKRILRIVFLLNFAILKNYSNINYKLDLNH